MTVKDLKKMIDKLDDRSDISIVDVYGKQLCIVGIVENKIDNYEMIIGK